jgi:hypothetical protein
MSETYNDLIFISVIFMSILLAWALSWIVLSIFKIKHNAKNKIYWLTSLFWSLVNILIATITIFSTLKIENYTLDRAISMRNIVLVNVFLDIVYIVIALILKSSSKDTKKQIGSAVLIQGLFLLVFDLLIVFVFQRAIN